MAVMQKTSFGIWKKDAEANLQKTCKVSFEVVEMDEKRLLKFYESGMEPERVAQFLIEKYDLTDYSDC